MIVTDQKSYLEAKLREIQLRALDGKSGLLIEQCVDPLDRAKDESSRNTQASLSERDRDLVNMIQEALGRIEEGRYGECAQCEVEIATRRLEFVPWATLCIDCQAHLEHREKVKAEKVLPRLVDHGKAMEKEAEARKLIERI